MTEITGDSVKTLWNRLTTVRSAHKMAGSELAGLAADLVSLAQALNIELIDPDPDSDPEPTPDPEPPMPVYEMEKLGGAIAPALLNIVAASIRFNALIPPNTPDADRPNIVAAYLLDYGGIEDDFAIVMAAGGQAKNTIAGHAAYLVHLLMARSRSLLAIAGELSTDVPDEDKEPEPPPEPPPEPDPEPTPDPDPEPPPQRPAPVDRPPSDTGLKLLADLDLLSDRAGIDPAGCTHVREIGPGKAFDPWVDSGAVQKAIQSIDKAARRDPAAKIALLLCGERPVPPGTRPFLLPPIVGGWAIGTEAGQPPALWEGIGRLSVAGCRSLTVDNVALLGVSIGFGHNGFVDSANNYYQTGWSIHSVALRNLAVADTLDDGIIAGFFARRALQQALGDDLGPPTVTLENLLLRHNGQSNHKHNLYLYCWQSGQWAQANGEPIDTDLSLVARNIRSYAANGAICFKAFAPYLHISDSYFATLDPDASTSYAAQTLVDIGACFKHTLIENCTFEPAVLSATKGNATAVAFRARRDDMMACALPPTWSSDYLGEDGGAFWQSVREHGEITPEHPHAMVGRIKNCEIRLDWRDKTAGIAPGVTNDGTRAIDRFGKFDVRNILLPIGEGFIERACTLLENCTIDGYPESKIYDGYREPWIDDGGKPVRAPPGTAPERKLFIR